MSDKCGPLPTFGQKYFILLVLSKRKVFKLFKVCVFLNDFDNFDEV